LSDAPNKDTYFVAVKLFLERDGGSLLVFKDRFGAWDLPGGRLLPDEFETPLSDVLRRKVAEELGREITYDIGDPVVFMRHQRIEERVGRPVVRIFAIGYRGHYLRGPIRLSAQHIEFKWVPVSTYDPATDFAGGWLRGMQDYLKLQRQR
jgi:8-oxo-dGTP pyrophosphatase MutT (NUDIX family)